MDCRANHISSCFEDYVTSGFYFIDPSLSLHLFSPAWISINRQDFFFNSKALGLRRDPSGANQLGPQQKYVPANFLKCYDNF